MYVVIEEKSFSNRHYYRSILSRYRWTLDRIVIIFSMIGAWGDPSIFLFIRQTCRKHV